MSPGTRFVKSVPVAALAMLAFCTLAQGSPAQSSRTKPKKTAASKTVAGKTVARKGAAAKARTSRTAAKAKPGKRTVAATHTTAKASPTKASPTPAASTSATPASAPAATSARPLIGPVLTPAHADLLSPVGHWVERGNNNNELQLWWDFNPDGTLTVTAGATAKTRWKLEGNTLTVGVATPQQPAGVFDVSFANGKLYSTPRVQNPPTLEYMRLGQQKFDSAPLVGRWQISNAPHAADPHEEEVRNRMVKAVTEYNSDGTYEVRAPIDATEGTWNASAHTYTLKGYAAMPFERKGTTLVLTSPVGPKGQRTYVPDGFF